MTRYFDAETGQQIPEDVAADISAMVDQPMADMINRPPYYAGTRWEAIEIIEALGNQFRLGNALKYIFRHQKKNGVEDLKKARWYLEREFAQDRPTSSEGFNRLFYMDNARNFAESFGIKDINLINAVSSVSSAHHHAWLGMVGAWRADVVDALACLNAYLVHGAIDGYPVVMMCESRDDPSQDNSADPLRPAAENIQSPEKYSAESD